MILRQLLGAGAPRESKNRFGRLILTLYFFTCRINQKRFCRSRIPAPVAKCFVIASADYVALLPPRAVNHPTIPLSTARASAPTLVVSLLTEIHLHPPLTFLNYPHRFASSDPPTLSPTSFTSPLNPTLPRTNRESRIQNP